MICDNCGAETSHIKINSEGKISCHACGNFSEAGGTVVDGLLTRTRFNVRHDSIMHEGDTIPPHKYNKFNHKVEPSEDFLKLYPQTAGEYFTKDELKKAGYERLKTKPLVNRTDKEVEFEGNSEDKLRELKL